MKVIDPGHTFELDVLDAESDFCTKPRLMFVKRVNGTGFGPAYPGNKPPAHEGTTLQEVFRACISRLQYVDNQLPHAGNLDIVRHLRESIMTLEQRAAERHGRLGAFRKLSGSIAEDVENIPTCKKCGHIYCEEHE